MKGILSICALALLGSVAAKTFPNDLYYHHHPDLAVADDNDFGYNLREGTHRSSFILKEGPYSGPKESTESVAKVAYRASYKEDKKGYLVYNEDGSINWDATKARKKKNKVAEDHSTDDGYDYHGRNQRGGNRFSSSDDSGRYDDDGYSNNRNTGPSRYNDNDRSNRGNHGNDYDDNYNSRGGYNAYKDTGNTKSGFGMRIAGADDDDDGYFRGVGTFYDLETRTGTCGKQNKNSEFVAALNAEQMGDSSSSNPNCGKEVEVTGPNGKTITVTIVDSCKTCQAGDLDFSPAAFEEIGDFSHGSIPIKWKFM